MASNKDICTYILGSIRDTIENHLYIKTGSQKLLHAKIIVMEYCNKSGIIDDEKWQRDTYIIAREAKYIQYRHLDHEGKILLLCTNAAYFLMKTNLLTDFHKDDTFTILLLPFLIYHMTILYEIHKKDRIKTYISIMRQYIHTADRKLYGTDLAEGYDESCDETYDLLFDWVMSKYQNGSGGESMSTLPDCCLM